DAPEIIGQEAIATAEDTQLTIVVEQLTISDPDNTSGFSIYSVGPGENYSVSGNTIVPAQDYNGPLTVPVVVTDGTTPGPAYDLNITVNAVNDAPVIVGQQPLSIP